ncbi:MAG: PAS domain S-box protein [Syntrophales bacterium]|nr:PAS domain S-box protein [Syntrophales bacterium]
MGGSCGVKEKLAEELTILRRRVGELERLDTEHKLVLSQQEAQLESLRKSESKYRLMTECMTDIVWTLDTDLKTTYVSPSITKILGFTQEERLGQDLSEVLTPKSHRRIMNTYAQEMAKERVGTEDPGRSVLMEAEYYHRDGHTVWLENLVCAIRDSNGKLVGIHGVSRDITKRKRAEDVLCKEYSFRNAVIDNVAEGICVWHETEDYPFIKLTIWNGPMTEITGYTMEEINRLGWYQTLYPEPELQAKAIKRLKKIRQGKELHAEEWDITHADGSKCVLSASFSFFDKSHDGLVHVMAIVRNVTDVKQPLTTLHERRALYRLLAENATDVIWTADMNLQFTYVTPSVQKLLGFTAEEVMVMPMSQLYTEASFEKAMQAFAEEMELEGSENADATRTRIVEVEMVRKDGKSVPVEKNVSFLRDPAGHPAGILSIVRDISERKLVEGALKESEERYRNIFENALLGIFQSTPTGVYLRGNLAFAKMFGYSSQEEMISYVTDIENQLYANPQDRRAIKEALESHGIAEDVVVEMRHRQGYPFWISLSARAVRNGRGDILYYSGTALDITERKCAEEKLRLIAEEKEWLLKSMTNAFAIFQSVFDEDDRFVSCRFEYINDSYERITGVTLEEAHGKTIYEVWPETESSWIENFGEVAVTGNPRTFDSFHGPTGKYYHSHVYRPWDAAERFCVIFEDITDHRKITDALIQSHEQMRALAGSLRDIREEERKRIARVIHDEMGQALTGIKMDLTWVQHQLADHTKTDWQEIFAHFESMKDLADVTIREMRRIIAELRPSVLDDLGVAAAIDWLGEDFRNKTGVKCRVDIPEEEINMDPEMAVTIFRIAQEALTNIVRHARATSVDVALRVGDGNLVLEVIDNGLGFSAENPPKTGSFGLLGMRERALAIGGVVDIKSSPGRGTKVRLSVSFDTQTVNGGHT